jgi:hypothetical protein
MDPSSEEAPLLDENPIAGPAPRPTVVPLAPPPAAAIAGPEPRPAVVPLAPPPAAVPVAPVPAPQRRGAYAAGALWWGVTALVTVGPGALLLAGILYFVSWGRADLGASLATGAAEFALGGALLVGGPLAWGVRALGLPARTAVPLGVLAGTSALLAIIASGLSVGEAREARLDLASTLILLAISAAGAPAGAAAAYGALAKRGAAG